ncbi:hydroxyethylthiazole kinase [Mangrovibacillus cuniculi]|uniref:Hydroxyethylthiazole kinase n=1 Tax=Mangrovibacillus cuniculi TaxID=2593652 RepID=A0A7S8HEF3_9BACI|nr:hydroxyethylthiazole kinase [Mangrovibacillus cuniculi]QPC45668.1 hydroxyethylthiazole kinase [Mangrovibacillus cuniculi]
MIYDGLLLQKIRQENPLVHNITNIVVANFSANGLLALGASPIMADSPEEMEDMVTIASSVVLNIGTLNPTTVEAMILAGKAANVKGVPVVLDPVGVGASQFRRRVVQTILQEVNVDVIRGNIGELATIADVEWQAKGVDAGVGSHSAEYIAELVATKHKCTVGMTGEIDIITDGNTVYKVKNGDPVMPLITGSGCLLSAVIGAFLGVESASTILSKVTTAIATYGVVGELAAEKTKLPGSFVVAFMDLLHDVTAEDIKPRLQIEEVVR